MDTAHTRKVIAITVGDENYEPTSEELQNIVEMFMNAKLDPAGGFISVKFPYRARILNITGNEAVVASTGWLSDDDIKACVSAYTQVSLNNLFNAHPEIDGVAAFRAELDKRMNQD